MKDLYLPRLVEGIIKLNSTIGIISILNCHLRKSLFAHYK
jgi:hypothetical protein